MEELKRTLEEVFKSEIIKIVISNKVKKDEKYNKIAINLKENNKNKFYQIEKFTDKQVFHENIKINEISDKVSELIFGNYKQMTAWSNNEIFDLKISKKGKIFLGKKKNDNSKIVTGVIVVRKEFAEKYPEQLKKFIDEYNESVAYTSSNVDETAQLIAEYGVVASAAIAKKALPKCHIVCYVNGNMKNALKGFLQVLYDQNPKSVGGSMPKDDFYYEY